MTFRTDNAEPGRTDYALARLLVWERSLAKYDADPEAEPERRVHQLFTEDEHRRALAYLAASEQDTGRLTTIEAGLGEDTTSDTAWLSAIVRGGAGPSAFQGLAETASGSGHTSRGSSEAPTFLNGLKRGAVLPGDRVPGPLPVRVRVPPPVAQRRGRVKAPEPPVGWARWGRWARSATSGAAGLGATASRTAGEMPARLPRQSIAQCAMR
jgi:hypothetical protein